MHTHTHTLSLHPLCSYNDYNYDYSLSLNYDAISNHHLPYSPPCPLPDSHIFLISGSLCLCF